MKAKKQAKTPRPRKLTRAEVLQCVDDLVLEIRTLARECGDIQKHIIENGFDACKHQRSQQVSDRAVSLLFTLAERVRYRGVTE